MLHSKMGTPTMEVLLRQPLSSFTRWAVVAGLLAGLETTAAIANIQSPAFLYANGTFSNIAQLRPPQRVDGRNPVLVPVDVEEAGLKVHLLPPEGDQLGHRKPWRYASNINVASLWPYRPARTAAAISFSTSSGVR